MKPGPDPFADPAARPERDALAQGGGGGPAAGEPGARRASRLARRDPDAPLDDSAEFQVRGAVSFEDLLRRAQRRGFAAGAGAGGVGVLLAVAAFSWLASQPEPSPGRAAVPERQPVAPEARALPSQVPSQVADAQALLGAVDQGPRPAAPARPEGTAARRSGKPRDAATGMPAPAPASAPAPAPASAPALASAPAPAPAPASVPAAAAPDDLLVLPALVLSPAGAPPAAPSVPPARPPDPAPASPLRRLEQAEVSAALAARRGAIEACLAAHPADAAAVGARRFHLDVTVVDSGRVSGADIDDAEVRGTALGECVLGVARGITFPAFDGEPVRVELPLRLAAKE